MKTWFLLFYFAAVSVTNSFTQALQMQSNSVSNKAWERLEIKHGKLFSEHQSIRPVVQTERLDLLLNQDSLSLDTSWEQNYLWNDNKDYFIYKGLDVKPNVEETKRNVWSYFYKNKAHLFSHYGKHHYITVDPLLNLSIGSEQNNTQSIFINRRGLQISGGIDHKVLFFSNIVETQLSSPTYVNDYVNLYDTYPGAGFLKSYKSSLFKVNKGYDFLLAEAAIQFKATKHIQLQFGHGRHFIGSGERSLFLSDFAPPSFYLQINTQIWKLHYQNLYQELSPESINENRSNKILEKKYTSSHYLSLNLTKNWNVGLFESVVFSRKKNFELQYLNPIILYRFVEQALGSPDNAFLGFHSNLILFNRFKLYGQCMLDEFVLKEVITNNNGWWANKYGFQLGLKYIDIIGLDGLDVTLEYNKIRPYTYSYRDSVSNYAHFQQAIAHPLGSNFSEFKGILNYSPNVKWNLNVNFLSFNKGIDSSQVNLGSNILKPHDTRPFDYGHKTGQGVPFKVLQSGMSLSYMALYNAWFEASFNYRSENNNGTKSLYWWQIGFRMNLNRQNLDF